MITDAPHNTENPIIRLTFSGPDGPSNVIELKSGRTVIGRSPNCDVQIDDETVSAEHCELEIRPNTATATDLGSANGTFVNDEPVQSIVLHTQDRLRIGSVDILFEKLSLSAYAVATMAPAPQSQPEPVRATASCANHPEATAFWACTECGRWLCRACVKPVKLDANKMVTLCHTCDGVCEKLMDSRTANERPRSYFTGFLEALVYPFRGTALFVVILNVILAAIAMALPSSSASTGKGRIPSLIQLLGGITGTGLSIIMLGVGALVTVYLREVLVSSTRGDLNPPNFPEFDLERIREVAAEFAIWGIICFGPYTVVTIWQRLDGHDPFWAGLSAVVAGAVYGVMALLGIVIYDDLRALSPLLVVPSIVRVPGRYATLIIFLALLASLQFTVAWLLKPIAPALAQFFANSFLAYGVMAGLRAMGWFYRCTEEDLAWS